MKTASLAFFFILAALSYPLASAAEAPDAHEVARAVDEHYNHLRTLQATFTEVYRGNGVDRTESGTLWLKKPGKMRWEYRSPKDKVFVSDGKSAWFYVPSDRQVRKTEVKKLEDLRSPIAFLLGKTHLEKELRGLSLAPDVPLSQAGDVVLRGVPQGLENRVSQVQLEITPQSQIRKIVIEQVDGSTTEYLLSEMEENRPQADARFQFTPPPGVETVEGDLGQ